MVSKVIKRDGATEDFDEKKIENAIRKASAQLVRMMAQNAGTLLKK